MINFTESVSHKSNNSASGRCGQETNIDSERATPIYIYIYIVFSSAGPQLESRNRF